jgi:GxxExxY protein
MTQMTQMTQPQIPRDPCTERILGAFFATYNELGWGYLESVYKRGLAMILRDLGADVWTEVATPVYLRGVAIGTFYADIVVDGRVIVECKTVEHLGPAHRAQLLNYLKATSFEVGLLLNFGERPQFERLIFSNSRKTRP